MTTYTDICQDRELKTFPHKTQLPTGIVHVFCINTKSLNTVKEMKEKKTKRWTWVLPWAHFSAIRIGSFYSGTTTSVTVAVLRIFRRMHHNLSSPKAKY